LILDTNALSAFVDGDEGVGAVLAKQAIVAIPVIVVGEYRYGISRSRHRKAYEEWMSAELGRFAILDVTTETTTWYVTVRSALRESGRPIPANDAWISALALQHAMPILSRDRHFEFVPDVRCVRW
jgi:predicted nucleic acid-binding protein